MLTPVLTEHLASVIPAIAGKLHRTYRKLDAEDIAQEIWAGALDKADRLETLLTSGDLGILSSELRRIGWRACKEDDRIRRAEKAATEGYSTDDEQFYTVGLLRLLLPAYLDAGVAAQPPKGRSTARSGLLSESGDYLAMMVDISRAMAQIGSHERKLITDYYSAPQGDDPDSRWSRNQLANSMGMTLNALEVRVSRAVRSLQRELGGDSPWQRRGSMEYGGDTFPQAGTTNRTGVNPESGVSGSPTRSQQAKLKERNRV